MPAKREPLAVPASGTRSELATIAWLFLRLGATAFGGPAAHIALMEEEVVRRRKWLTQQAFLDLLGAANLIPGPNSTELAIHIGWQRARLPGLLLAGACFVLPAVLSTSALAWGYVRFGAAPDAAWLLYGVKPVVLGIVIQAIASLAPKAAPSLWLRCVFVSAVALSFLGVHEIAILFAAGAITAGRSWVTRVRPPPPLAWAPLASFALPAKIVGAAGGATASALFWVFLKIGSVLFGSGYVLLAFLRSELVERLGWLTEAQLMDAVAIGQVTPGPVFTTATFIGYVVAGSSGAAAATVGIFLPAFVFVAASGPIVPRLRASAGAAAFLDGVNAASLALMVVVTFELARTALVDWPTILLGLASAACLLRFKPNSAWLIGLAAAFGWVVHALGLAAG